MFGPNLTREAMRSNRKDGPDSWSLNGSVAFECDSGTAKRSGVHSPLPFARIVMGNENLHKGDCVDLPVR